MQSGSAGPRLLRGSEDSRPLPRSLQRKRQHPRQVLADLAEGVVPVNRPNLSNSGTSSPSGNANMDLQISWSRAGIAAGIQRNNARSLSRRYTCIPRSCNPASVTRRPVSSNNSRTAAATRVSPGSARPLGMSQRGDRVAWPSRIRCPSVTITPHEIRFVIQQGCATNRVVGSTNSCCAATVMISARAGFRGAAKQPMYGGAGLLHCRHGADRS